MKWHMQVHTGTELEEMEMIKHEILLMLPLQAPLFWEHEADVQEFALPLSPLCRVWEWGIIITCCI